MVKLIILLLTLVPNKSKAFEPIVFEYRSQEEEYKIAIRTVAKAFYKGSPLEQQTRRTLKKYKKEYVSQYYEPHYVVSLMVAQSLIEGRIRLQYRWEF